MIQKRREQFKREIRRKQLDEMFRQRRMQLLQPLHFQSYMESIYTSKLGKWITQCMMEIKRLSTSQNYQQIQKSFESIFVQLKQHAFQVSAYVIILSSQISQAFRALVESEPSQMEGRNLSSFQQKLVVKYLELLALICYRQLREDYFFQLISSLWLIFPTNWITVAQNQCNRIFDLVLRVFRQMLSSKSRIVLSNLKSMGLGFQLTKIIQYDSECLSYENEMNLICIVHDYVSLECRFNNNKLVDNKKGASILQLQASEKKILVAFCLYIINRRYEEGYYEALDALVSIFEKHQYLISSVDIKYAQEISGLINLGHQKVQRKALELTDDMIYLDNDKGNQLLKDCYLPKIIHQFLVRQLQFPSEYTRSLCCIASNIICNLTLCKSKEMQQFINHPLWEFAYSNMYMGSPLLPLLSIFQFYFQIINRKTAIRLLQNYLCNIGQLQLDRLQRRQSEAIKRIVQRVYVHCLDFWPEEYQSRLLGFLQQNKLKYMLQDLMDIEQQKQLNSI